MAKEVIKLGLEFDTKKAIQSYRDLIAEMDKNGADPKAIKQFTAAVEKAETQLAQLAAEGSTGFDSSKGIERFQKKVVKTVTSMQQLAIRMQTFSKNSENFPVSEAKKLEEEIEKLKNSIIEIQKTAKEGLVKSLTDAGFSKKEAENIANTVKSEEELLDRLEKERQIRAEISKQAGNAYKAAQKESLRKSGEKVTEDSALVKGVTGDVARIEGIKDKDLEFTREKVAEAIRKGIKQGWSANKVKQYAQTAIDESKIDQAMASEIIQALETGFTRGGEDIKTYIRDAGERALAVPEKAKHAKALDNYSLLAEDSEIKPSIYSAWVQSLNRVTEAQEKLTNAEARSVTAAQNTRQAQENITKEAANLSAESEKATTNFMNMTNAQKDAAKSAEQMDNSFIRLGERLKYMFGFSAMFYRMRQIIRSTFNDIQQLDKAYASIAYVTNETVSSLWSTYSDYASMAEKLGQSTKDIIEASAIYRQQGLDTAEAIELTTDTMKLATIAGNDYATATREMTAALRGFKMEMTEGSHVADVYSELAAHAAASVDGIAQAMSRTASIANSAGMSFENTSAFLTQMIETTQESAENIGTSLKTIIARFTELKENVAGTEDSEFEDLDFNKIDKALKSVGVSLKDTEGQFRNLDDVFLDLSEKWNSLDRNTQRYVATIAAGSRQQSRFIAMMDNYDRTIELINIAADSENKADEQFAKAADTIEFKLNTIKTRWEELKLEIMDSNLVKMVLDNFSSIMNGLKNLKMPNLLFTAPVIVQVAKNFILNFLKIIRASTPEWKAIGKTLGENFINSWDKVKKGKFHIISADEKAEMSQTLNEIQEKMASSLGIAVDPTKLKNFQNAYNQLRSTWANSTTTLNEVTDALRAYGFSEGEVKQLLKEYNITAEQSTGIIRNQSREIENLGLHINLLRGDVANATQLLKQLNAAARSEGIVSGFKTIGQSASLMTMSLISGATAVDSLNVAFGTLLTQSMGLLFQFIPKAITLLNAEKVAKAQADAAYIAGEEAKQKELLKTAQTARATFISSGWGLLVVAIAAAVAWIAKLFAKQVELNKQKTIEYQLQQKINKIKELERTASQAKSEVQSAKDQLKSTEDMLDRFNELSKMHIKTTEEQEEYNNLVEKIRSEYPSIVSSYTQVTNQLTIQEDKTDNILKMQKQLVAEQQKSYAYAQANLSQTSIEKAQLEAQQKRNGLYDPFTAMVRKESDYGFWKTNFWDEIREGLDAGESSRKIIESNLERYGIDEQTFLRAAGYDGELSAQKWDELAEKLKNDRDEIYDVIKDTCVKIEEQINEEYETTKAYYEDMEAASLKQVLQTSFEDIGDSTASAIAEATIKNKTSISQDIFDAINMIINGKGIPKQEETSVSTNLANSALNAAGVSGGVGVPGVPGVLAAGVTNGAGLYKTLTGGDDLPEWKELTPDVQNVWKEVAKQYGRDDYLDWYKEIYKDAEQYQQFKDDFKNIAEAQAKEKWSEEIGQILEKDKSILEQFNIFGDSFANGEYTYADLETVGSDIIQSINTSSNLSSDEEEQLINLINTIIANYQNIVQDKTNKAYQVVGPGVSKLTGEELDTVNQFIDNTVEKLGEESGKAYLASVGKAFEKYTPQQIAALTNVLDFTEANAYNWESFKQNGIKAIDALQIEGIDSAEDAFNEIANIATESGLYRAAVSVGDSQDIQADIESRNKAIEENQDILDKILGTNKPLKLTQNEIKKLKKAIDELNASGVNLDLSQYLEGDTIATNEFHDALTSELMFSIEQFNKALEVRTLTDKEREALEAAKELAESFNIGAAETFENWNKVDSELNDLTTTVDNVDKAVKQFNSDGYVSAESLDDLSKILGDTGDLYKYVDNNLNLNIDALKQYIHETLEASKAAYINGEATAEQVLKYAALQRQIDSLEKEWDESKQKKIEDYQKAQQDVIDKQKELNEAIEEYNKLLYGSEHRSSGLDLLYNYSQALSVFSDEMARAQEMMEDADSVDKSVSILTRYANAAHQRLAYLKALESRYDTGLNARKDNLLNGSTSYTNEQTGEVITVNFGDYVKYNADTGLMAIDQKLIQEAKIADEWKDYIEKQVEDYNKIMQDSLKNQDEIRKLEKEIQKRREEGLKKYADFESNIADILKEQYQKEVDDLKNKYDSMKQIDDEYLDALQEAIEKQRKLREKENKWEELAQKEKRLSLMSRDTSGANAIETRKLEDEVQKDREQMLDDSIDSAIENMQKLSEKQEELRQTEIELKEALLDNTAYWNNQAENVAKGFETAEDYAEWFKQNATKLNEETAIQFEISMMEARDKFTEASEGIAWEIKDEMSETGDFVCDTITVTAEEIEKITSETSDTFETEISNTLAKTKKDFEDNLDSAITKIESAQKSLQEAINKLKEFSEVANGEYNPDNVSPPSSTSAKKGNEDNDFDINALTEARQHAHIDEEREMYDKKATEHYYQWISTLNDGMGEYVSDNEIKEVIKTILDFKNSEDITRSLLDQRQADIAKSLLAFPPSKDRLKQLGFKNETWPEEQYNIGFSAIGLSDPYIITKKEVPPTYEKYAVGGLVNYTGPAWVDGTPSKPEAFLSAEDTERIGLAAKLLSDLPFLNPSVNTNSGNTFGDTNIEVNLNIDHISSDVDIESMLSRVKQEIVDIAKPIGTNVILQQGI